MQDYTHIKHLVVMGSPRLMVEDIFGHLPVEGFTYIGNLFELVDPGELITSIDDLDLVVNTLLALVKRGGAVYLGSVPELEDAKALNKLIEVKPDAVIDEALEVLKNQLPGAIDSPEAFEAAVFEAMEAHLVDHERVVFTVAEFDNACAFHAPKRASQPHTLKWCADGAIELDGAILRRTALMGIGHLKREVLGGKVLDPAEVVGFVATRLAINGVEDLVGYGRAFGPGKEDHTNATLTAGGRKFRSRGIVGVVSVHAGRVTKAKPDMVVEVVSALHCVDPTAALFLHQQCKEIYEGEDAMEAFRGVREADNRITLHGKSTKHTRVDAGAYCLYTDNDGLVTVPAVIGNFELSNDGMVYAPKLLLDGIGGHLKESVKAIRDFANMSEDLLSRYYNATLAVVEGDRIAPGDTVFTIDGIPHTWDSKADYGIVTETIDVMNTRVVHVEVRIDAYFEGDVKMRGFGKGLVAPMEACGMHCSEGGRFVIGAAGIIKDSAAAKSHMSNITRGPVKVSTVFNQRDFDLAIAKHQPEPGNGDWLIKEYPELYQISFHPPTRTITVIDDDAILCDITFMIEASPVGQSVGSSSMTMPQLSWLSSLPSANAWLKGASLPGVIRRIDALAYLHAVSNRVPLETRGV